MLNWRFQQPASAIQIPASIARDIELAQSADFSLGNVQVQPATLQVIDGTCSSTLERRVMQVLVALASRRGAVASRAYLVDACWGGRAISEDAINRCILKLRRLGAATDSFEIQTIPTVGYRLIERETVSSGRQRERLTQWQWVGAALVSLAAISGLLWHFATTGVPGSPSIAVGTFTALNSDPDAKLYAASITSAVSDALVGTGARLASAEEPITTVDRARRADAALLVAGTIRNQNNTIKVTVTVQSVRTGVTLVSTDFQSPASEASSLADHLAATVASRLNPWVTVAKTERDPVVCEQILRSWSLLFSNPLKAWSVAKDLAAAKPNSAAAQEAFAATTAYWLDDIPRDQRDAMVAAAREAAARAATLNPAKAFLLSCLLRPPGLLIMTARCDAAVRRSLATDSSSPFESAYFAEMLANSGRLREALSVSETSLADSPYDAGRISLRMFIIQMEYSGDHQTNCRDCVFVHNATRQKLSRTSLGMKKTWRRAIWQPPRRF
jgi:DNA-binding winged helix-turn-helix (wHTH) protein/TolB-like protein